MDVTRADEAEAAVIGAVLQRGDIIDSAAQYLGEQDFLNPDYAEIFSTVLRLRRNGHAEREIDWLVVAGEARTVRRLSVADLDDLSRSTPVLGNVGFYAQQVREASLRRNYRLAAGRIAEAVEATETVEDLTQIAYRELHLAGTSTTGQEIGSRTWEAISAEIDSDHYDWVIPGLMESSDRFVLTGGEGSGKSMFLRQAGMMTAGGLHCFTGKPIEPKRVLVVDVENNERQWRRTMAPLASQIKRHGGDLAERLQIACSGRLDLTKESHIASLYRLIDSREPDMVIIGPLYKLTPKAINNDDDAAPLITALDGIRDRGIAIMLEHHMGHAKNAAGDRDPRPRGSSALLGWPEFGFGLVPLKLEGGEMGQVDPNFMDLVPWRGQRDARNWPDRFRRGGEWPWSPV